MKREKVKKFLLSIECVHLRLWSKKKRSAGGGSKKKEKNKWSEVVVSLQKINSKVVNKKWSDRKI